MAMTKAEVRDEYRWEDRTFPDLAIGLDHYMAIRWTDMLKIELGIHRMSVGFFYCMMGNGKLKGEASIGETPWDGEWRKTVRIHLYPPHSLRTLGHELTHAARWLLHDKVGHGDTWRQDLTRTHEIIRKHLPRLHWCDLGPELIGQRSPTWDWRLGRHWR